MFVHFCLYYQGNLLDGNETEVRIDSCTGDKENEIEITILWEEEPENGENLEPGIPYIM